MLNSMHLKRFLILLNIVACLSSIALATRAIIIPIIAKAIYKEDYKDLVFQCDNTMRDHLIAKNQLQKNPSENSLRDLHSAEVALLSCHEYDKLRKQLLILGLTEADLAFIGLEAIEERAKDVRNFVETHEIRY